MTTIHKTEKIVYKTVIARKLLQEGFVIMDVQNNRTDERRTVFFFRNDEGLEERIKELSKWAG